MGDESDDRPRIVTDLVGFNNGQQRRRISRILHFRLAQCQDDGSEIVGRAAADVNFAGDPGQGEADPEGDSEELVWLKVGEARSGEEDAHDRAGGCDAEEDGKGAGHPHSVLGDVVA